MDVDEKSTFLLPFESYKRTADYTAPGYFNERYKSLILHDEQSNSGIEKEPEPMRGMGANISQTNIVFDNHVAHSVKQLKNNFGGHFFQSYLLYIYLQLDPVIIKVGMAPHFHGIVNLSEQGRRAWRMLPTQERKAPHNVGGL